MYIGHGIELIAEYNKYSDTSKYAVKDAARIMSLDDIVELVNTVNEKNRWLSLLPFIAGYTNDKDAVKDAANTIRKFKV